MIVTRYIRQDLQFSGLRRASAAAALCLGLAACAANGPPRPSLLIADGAPYPISRPAPGVEATSIPVSLSNGATSGPEFFSVAAYGVAASPRVATGVRMPRGGGYEKIGSPYTVKGRRYYPTRTPKAVQTGKASWYGAAFHGRKTANGEVYDMNHLTAAHKTMPLPSYARVTNLANNRSLIVRVNDRGPFSNNRIIDLSKRAAEMLDYTKAGTANVRVEYVGPAPLHGQDDEYLMASFRGPPVYVQQPTLVSAFNAAQTVSDYATMRINGAFGVGATDWKRP